MASGGEEPAAQDRVFPYGRQSSISSREGSPAPRSTRTIERFLLQRSATIREEALENANLPEEVRNYEKQLSFQNSGGLAGCLEKAVAARTAAREANRTTKEESSPTSKLAGSAANSPTVIAQRSSVLVQPKDTPLAASFLTLGGQIYSPTERHSIGGADASSIEILRKSSSSMERRLKRYNTETLEVSLAETQGKGLLRLTTPTHKEEDEEEGGDMWDADGTDEGENAGEADQPWDYGNNSALQGEAEIEGPDPNYDDGTYPEWYEENEDAVEYGADGAETLEEENGSYDATVEEENQGYEGGWLVTDGVDYSES